MLKAGREAKLSTTWTDPNQAYEKALEQFVAAVLQPADDAPFLTDVALLVSRIANGGAWNALARIAVHLTAPGTPDIYQGDELWNFTLVDPDNRRQVDYDARVRVLGELPGVEQRLHEQAPLDPHDNRVKLLVTHRLLTVRRAHPDLFARGSYLPLRVRGARAGNVIAFARSLDGRHSMTIAPRLAGALESDSAAAWWGDTAVELPAELEAARWHSQLASGEIASAGGSLLLSTLLEKLPVAVLIR